MITIEKETKIKHTVPSSWVKLLLYAISEGFLISPYFTVIGADKKHYDSCSFVLFVKRIPEFSINGPYPNSNQVVDYYNLTLFMAQALPQICF